jgi:hypothetical protein
MAGLTTNHLEFVVDGNRNLHGCYTPVSSLLIVGPDSITKALVDEIIVFNYAYINEIKNTLSTFIQNGGRVVSVIDLLRESDRPK